MEKNYIIIVDNLPDFIQKLWEFYLTVSVFYMFIGFMLFLGTGSYLYISYMWIRYKEKLILVENRGEQFSIFDEYEGEAITGEMVKGRLIESIRLSISDEKGNLHDVYPNTVRIIRAMNYREKIKRVKDFFTYKIF